MAKGKTKTKPKTKPKAEFPIDPSEFLHHPHDRYVRFALQIRDLAMEFLQYSLDTRTKALIDWDSLQISKESYIDERLKAHYSDICYTGLMPTFDYILVDLSNQTEVSLEALQMLYLDKFLTALKHSRDDDYIAFYWKKFVIFAPNHRDQTILRQFSVATVLYLNATSTVFNKKLKDMDNLLTTEEQADVKPYLFELLDQKMEEGRAEGMENTIRLFLIKNPNWTDQQIVECFEVTIEFVSKIRAK
jgi:hypothetical protein